MSKFKHHHLNSLTFFNLFLIFSSILSPSFSFPFASSSHLHRRDPLQHFEFYNGGFNLQNKHYWASAVFTGVHGYAMAGVWMICGLGCGIYLMITKNVFSDSSSVNHKSFYSDFTYYLVFFMLLLFSLIAIVATGLVIAENHKTFEAAKKVKETLVGAGNEARRTIHKINKAVSSIQSLLCPYDQPTCLLLNSTAQQLGTQSYNIKKFIINNDHSIDQALRALDITNLVVVAVNLLFLVSGLVLIFLYWHPGIFFIIFVWWILTMTCWFLTGIDYFIHNFAEDTCTALEEFHHNPQNSSLSSLLPCAHALKSQNFVMAIAQTVHDFITQLNLNMNSIMPKQLGLDGTNYEKVIGTRKICDPFAGPPDYQFQTGKCPKKAIPIRDLPDILAKFTCESESSMESCNESGKFLPKPTYLMAYAYIRSIQYLTNVYPDLEDLIHCSFLKNTISDVVLHQCKPFKATTYVLWASILCLSISMLLLVLLLVAKAYQHHGRFLIKSPITPTYGQP
ncbi:uncharacterized protein LOC130821247 isoform X1 [Amaranthus tricolor]|uniref:uncharacterized protein LOC130821247 isoform X1 n=1 Tax=Amaranthus tricolor TaxID=29722 RepID=UPI002590A8D3|nr:uncharacterized protein LOC130821247 isoform X1 [Amaranthus tricolor]